MTKFLFTADTSDQNIEFNPFIMDGHYKPFEFTFDQDTATILCSDEFAKEIIAVASELKNPTKHLVFNTVEEFLDSLGQTEK